MRHQCLELAAHHLRIRFGGIAVSQDNFQRLCCANDGQNNFFYPSQCLPDGQTPSLVSGRYVNDFWMQCCHPHLRKMLATPYASRPSWLRRLVDNNLAVSVKTQPRRWSQKLPFRSLKQLADADIQSEARDSYCYHLIDMCVGTVFTEPRGSFLRADCFFYDASLRVMGHFISQLASSRGRYNGSNQSCMVFFQIDSYEGSGRVIRQGASEVPILAGLSRVQNDDVTLGASWPLLSFWHRLNMHQSDLGARTTPFAARDKERLFRIGTLANFTTNASTQFRSAL
eukprot:4625210-Amphidinium_carterae.1